MTSAPQSRRAVLAAAAGTLLAACTRSRQSAARPPSPQPLSSRSSSTPQVASAPPPAAATAAGGGTQVLRHGPTGRPEVALTFHGSGDTALANRLLVEAEQAGAHITVFAVGTWLQQHPEMAKRILRGGHDLGNHTYTHPTLHRLSAKGIADEVSRCATLLQRLTGSPGAAFRPSGGPSITPPMVTAATASGYRLVLGYDVDPSDNLDPGAAAVASRVLAGVRAGSVVSLHLGHAGTVDALPHILAGLRSKGLRAVSATRLVTAS